jgi:hypothetical protein
MASDDTLELMASAVRTTVTEIRSVIVFGVRDGEEADPEPMLVLLINGELALYFGLEATGALDSMLKEVPKRIEIARIAMSVHRAGGPVQMTTIAGPDGEVKKKN